MSRVTIFGATGALGSHVARQALAAGHAVSAVVRTPTRLAPEIAARASVRTVDLATQTPAAIAGFVGGQDVMVNCAGHVSEGEAFVDLFDRVVSAVESLPGNERPVCWFLAGAAMLEIGTSGRRGVDLPKVRDTYRPHRVNFERLERSRLDWRLLCPGPMVERPALGVERLRVSADRLPVEFPAFVHRLPAALLLPLFAARVPEMIIPYADAAALMLANLAPGGPMSRKRIGMALPRGMRGRKDQWAARPRAGT